MVVPASIFDDIFYSHIHRDSGDNALAHYSTVGARENRQANPHFSPGWFRRTYPESEGVSVLEFVARNGSTVFPNPLWKAHGWNASRLAEVAAMAGRVKSTAMIGLFGTGRTYLTDLVLSQPQIGLLLHHSLHSVGNPSRFPVICSGHATMLRTSSLQHPPAFSEQRLIAPMQTGLHNIVLAVRHPLDALLSNWAWWRHYSQTRTEHLLGINGVFGSTERFCADVEANIEAFTAFATNGDLSKLGIEDMTFLSLEEFLDETLAWMNIEGVQIMRFEDFTEPSGRQFEALNRCFFPNGDLRLTPVLPRAKPYPYREIVAASSRIKNVLEELLSPSIREKIAHSGYAI